MRGVHYMTDDPRAPRRGGSGSLTTFACALGWGGLPRLLFWLVARASLHIEA